MEFTLKSVCDTPMRVFIVFCHAALLTKESYIFWDWEVSRAIGISCKSFNNLGKDVNFSYITTYLILNIKQFHRNKYSGYHFQYIVNFQNIPEWSKTLLYQLYPVMLLSISKIYQLFNKFEILVVIAIPKFEKSLT